MNRFLFILLFCCSVFGQMEQKGIKQLHLSLQKTVNPIEKVDILNQLSDAHKSNNPKLTLQYAQEAFQLAKQIQYPYGQAIALLNMGNAAIVMGNGPLALQHFLKAQDILNEQLTVSDPKEKQNLELGLARVLGSIGVVFSEQSEYDKALLFHFKSVKIYEDLKKWEDCAKVYNNIGVEYEAQNEYLKSLQYYYKALKLQEGTQDASIGITIANIGNVYLKQKNFTKAFEYYSKAQAIFKQNQNQRGLGDLYNSLGNFYSVKKLYSEAISFYNQAITVFRTLDDTFGLATSYNLLAELYLEQHQFDKAMEFSQQSLTYAKALENWEMIAANEKVISTLYELKNDNKNALVHFKNFNTASEVLKNEVNIRNSVRAEMNFEFAKKEVLNRKEAERQAILFDEKLKRNYLILFFSVTSLILLIGIGFLIYNRMQLKKHLLLQKELAEYEQKALHLQMNPHFVFNCLGSISSFIVQNGTDSAIKYLAKFSKLMRLTLEYSKEPLIPIDKEIESLQNYLELEQLRFNKKFEFTITKSNEIEDDMAIPSLLLQPFVENSVIHGLVPKAALGAIRVHFSVENDFLFCKITDDGVGYLTSRKKKEHSVVIHKSMALDITKKRLEMMEAFTTKKTALSINEIYDDFKNVMGTEVILQLPIQYCTN